MRCLKSVFVWVGVVTCAEEIGVDENGKTIWGLLVFLTATMCFELLALVSAALIFLGGDEEYQSGDQL